MKKFSCIIFVFLMIITLVGCTNNSTSTPQNAPISQSTEIKLTTSNISSYLGIDVNNTPVILNNVEEDEHGLYYYADLHTNIEISVFPMKNGTFKNAVLTIECTPDDWDFTFEPKNKLTFSLPVDGRMAKTLYMSEAVYCRQWGANADPDIKAKIISVTGSFIEE